ncbi:hypothetical protein WJM93_14205 [Lactiplantibacillus plantarum]|uniref:hypothetical protein n=1 Tax=Lactiplantibacillus plantarum TaxID=1590 RepID=UPI0021A8FFDE|nr:hypothetical protein [Lactiplantibacillus plantarum]MCT3206462.1 hypothetical protein [Lactiplantibacillus plantarum]MCT3220178.1 hypothetical protein [Lactiplantibacillus plantarum]MCT3281546.1 hypothetical protein [Lactiplantibacillus plantarum]
MNTLERYLKLNNLTRYKVALVNNVRDSALQRAATATEITEISIKVLKMIAIATDKTVGQVTDELDSLFQENLTRISLKALKGQVLRDLQERPGVARGVVHQDNEESVTINFKAFRSDGKKFNVSLTLSIYDGLPMIRSQHGFGHRFFNTDHAVPAMVSHILKREYMRVSK